MFKNGHQIGILMTILWQYVHNKSWADKHTDIIEDVDGFIAKTHKNLVPILKQYIPKGSKALELGSSPFWLIVLLRQHGVQAYGLEYEQASVTHFKKRYPKRASWVFQGDASNVPYKDNTFDAVFSIGLIEHFVDEKFQIKMVREHTRLIKNDGVCLISVPWLNPIRTLLYPYTVIKETIYRLLGKPFYQKIYSTRAFKRLLNKGGLRIEKLIPLTKNHMLLAVCRKIK